MAGAAHHDSAASMSISSGMEVTTNSSCFLQEPAWLVRHAVMESLVEVLRGSPELDPRALVPPRLLAAGPPWFQNF